MTSDSRTLAKTVWSGVMRRKISYNDRLAVEKKNLFFEYGNELDGRKHAIRLVVCATAAPSNNSIFYGYSSN